VPRIRVNLKGKPSDYGLHPWIFRDRVKGVIGQGFEAAVYVKGKFFGSAFYNPEGKLALRFYSRDEEDFTAGLVYSRIQRARNEREGILGFKNAYRLFFAEADNMPGIIADVYGRGAVIQISSYGADRLRREIVEGFRMAGYRWLYEKSDSYARRQEGLEPYEGWHFYDEEISHVWVEINGLKFKVPIGGQKTGMYLDQRLNWDVVGRTMRGRKRVLDAFSYTGGFTLHLLKYGVEKVVAIDEDGEALNILKENVEANGFHKKSVETFTANVFDMLDSFLLAHERFDGIILDPPAFAKGRNVSGARRGYFTLFDRALRLLDEGGLLAVFSCSRHIGFDLLEGEMTRAAKRLLREVKILYKLHQSPDHPVPVYFPDAEYLRGFLAIVY